MSSADCECCGQPATVPDPVPAEPEECDCDCLDCDECEDCFHDCECGDCESCGYDDEQPVILCHSCAPEDGDEVCGPGAWHCTCGRACDGSACPGEAVTA